MNYNSLALNAFDMEDQLRADIDIEDAMLEKQQAWKAELASMDHKARYRTRHKAILR